MITANEVKSTLRSLRAKINKETGKEHATIAEGVEDLVLGYGIGQGEAWDGKIYVNGEIAKDVKDYFEEGRQAGLEEAERIIIGTFVLGAKQKPVAEQVVTINDVSEVYAYFYNGSTYEKELISSITFSPADELASIYSLDRTKFLKYIESDGTWSYSNNEINGELPYGDGVIIAFSEQTLVPGNFYKTFMSAVSEEDAYHEGEQAENIKRWNGYTANNTRTNFDYAFFGSGWNDKTFNPPFDTIQVGRAGYMFKDCLISKSEHLKKLNFSGCSNFIQTFMNAPIEELGIIDASNAMAGFGGLNQTFYGCEKLKKIEKLILPTASVKLEGAFSECSSLVEIRFEGTAYQTLLFQCSTSLSKESITSILNALSDSTSGFSVTFSKMAVDNAFRRWIDETASLNGSETTEWKNLIATKPNWTINLVNQ